LKIPEEVFSDKRLDIGQFRMFGSSVYFHVTKDAWKKLESIEDLGIFVEYTDTPHNYWVYLPTNRMIVVHRDVRFDEEKVMHVSLEREFQLHVVEEILAPKVEEPQIDVVFLSDGLPTQFASVKPCRFTPSIHMYHNPY